MIVVSGKIKDSDVLSALKAGAADHMTRSNLMRLNAAVEREIRAAKSRRDRIRLEEQFHQAQKMEAVGRLAGGVAHDFNNLLTVITGYSDLLLTSRDLKDNQRTALEEIRRSAERGGALTHQLLAFSRRQPMVSRVVHVNDLIIQIEKMLRRLIGEDIDLVTIPAAAQDTVTADPGRLEQVIMNLVVNARDAMPHGGKLTIETATVHLGDSFSAKHLGVPAGPHVTVSITDTGVGMDEETQSHLFEPFFTTKGPGSGTGLGLATAYGIIRQSGGAIGMFSELGTGTTARIYLPLAETKTQTATEKAPSDSALNGVETILVVEDEARVRKLIVDVLTARGYQRDGSHPRRRGHSTLQATEGQDRSGRDRRGHARDERARPGEAGGAGVSRDARVVHFRLHRRSHCAPRHSAIRRGIPAEAFHAGFPGAQGAGSAGHAQQFGLLKEAAPYLGCSNSLA